MRAPLFWQYRPIKAELLLPFGVLYCLGVMLKQTLQRPMQFSVPIICIGNFTLGGSGKTPTAITVAKLLHDRYPKLAFVSRGYGGKLKKPTRVDSKTHTARDVGDEPLLLARHAPCYVGKSKKETVAYAIQNGATLIILDDGMQNTSVAKDLTVAVVDGGYGLGNRFPFPAGPLREPLARGMKRTDAILFVGPDDWDVKEILADKKPIFDATIEPNVVGLPRKNYLAFAGIARPDKFFQSLISFGVYLRYTIGFADHHHYRPSDIGLLEQRAAEKESDAFITTEKDFVRLPAEFAQKVTVFPITVQPKDTDAFTQFMLKKLGKK